MKFTLLLILIISSTLLSAQDSTEKRGYPTFRLDEIEVTDSRTGIELKDLGKQVEVITQYEISQMPVNSVDELLRYIPGVEVQSRGMYGTQADITMRGGTYNQTLILLDGIRIGDPMTGHFNSNIPVTLSAIRRIEIIKGASSVIYGADAVGGVINIVTNNSDFFELTPLPGCFPDSTDMYNYRIKSDQIKHLQLDLSIAQYSTYGIDFYFNSTNRGDVIFDIFYNHNESYGYPAFNNSHNYGFNIHTGGTSFSFKLNENDYFAFRITGDWREFDARYFYTASPLDKSKEQVDRYFTQTKLKIGSYEGHDITANLGLIYTTDDFVFNPAFTPNNHKTISGDLNIHDQIKLGESTAMTFGTELQFNNMRSTDRGDRSQQQLGLYTVGVHDFNSDFNINAGLRGEYLPTNNWEIVPSFGANFYLTDKVKIRANAGRSIRTPDYTERYVSTGLEGILSAGRNLGNPDLLPEISWNYEAGTDIQLAQKISLNLTGYMRDSKNIIDYGFKKGSEITNNQNLDPTFDYLYAQNLAELQVKGIEFKISGYDFGKYGLKNFNWYVGGNILDITVADDVSSKYITNAAGLNFSAGLFYIINEQFKISTDAIYRKRDVTEDQSIEFGLTPEYFVMDAKFTYSYFYGPFNLYLSVKNIFDKDYSDILGVQLPGRWIMLGVNVSENLFLKK
jgi:outer membrane cobalamin receptor